MGKVQLPILCSLIRLSWKVSGDRSPGLNTCRSGELWRRERICIRERISGEERVIGGEVVVHTQIKAVLLLGAARVIDKVAAGNICGWIHGTGLVWQRK